MWHLNEGRVHEWNDTTFESEYFEDRISKKILKELKIIVYTNNVYFFFRWLNHKNLTIKYVRNTCCVSLWGKYSLLNKFINSPTGRWWPLGPTEYLKATEFQNKKEKTNTFKKEIDCVALWQRTWRRQSGT